MHTWKERMWASPQWGGAQKRGSCHLYRSVLPGLCLPSGQLSGFFSTPDLPWDPPLGCPCTPQPRWISKWSLLGRVRFIMAWHYPLTFDPHAAFLCMCSVSLVPEEEGREIPESFIQTGFCFSVSLRCLQETNTGYLPCFCFYFHFRGKTGGWLWMSPLEPTYLLSQEMQIGG